MAEQVEQVLAAFLIDDPVGARRFLTEIKRIDESDPDVRIVDAAIADRTKRGRVKVHQTEDTGTAKGAARGTLIGVVAGTILLGPAGPVVGGVLGGTLGGLRNRIHDVGIGDKFIREVTSGIDKGKTVLFVLYEGHWSATIGAVQDLIKAEHAQLIQSTLPPEKAAALQALVATVVEELGGEEAIADYEVEIEAPSEEAEQAADSDGGDDLTRIAGVGPDASAALVGAGIVRYSQLASTSEPDARRVLTDAGVAAPDNVSTWAMQAAFAANGDWPGLDAYLRASQSDAGAPMSATGGAGTGSDDLTQLSGIGPKAAEALSKAGIATYASLAEANEPQVRHALHESDMTPPAGVGTWPMQASFAARGDWQGLQRYNQKRTRATPAKSSTSASRPTTAAPDDLTQIKGIGPRVASLLADYDIATYADLEHASTQQLREIVALGGILPPATLDTWPGQAAYAARADWQGLATYNQRHR